MQYVTSLIKFSIVGFSIGYVFFLLYQTQTDRHVSKNSRTSADYFLNEQQYFQSNSTATTFTSSSNSTNKNDTLACNCSSLPLTANKATFVTHGENKPVIVPEYLPDMEPDIADKIHLNKDQLTDSILITIASYQMRHELYNWMSFMNKANETTYLIFCTDLKIYTHLIVAGHEDRAALIPDEWLVGDTIDDFRNTTLSILDDTRLSHVKTWVLQRLLYNTENINPTLLDVNQIIMRPKTLDYIYTLMQIRRDTKLIATQDGLDRYMLNTGLLVMRSGSSENKRLLAKTIQIQQDYPNLTQQQAMNAALDQLDLNVRTGMTVMLDMLHFPNGASYFEANSIRSKDIEPYIVHANHKMGEERIKELKKHKLWEVDEGRVNSISEQVEGMWTRRILNEQELQDAF